MYRRVPAAQLRPLALDDGEKSLVRGQLTFAVAPSRVHGFLASHGTRTPTSDTCQVPKMSPNPTVRPLPLLRGGSRWNRALEDHRERLFSRMNEDRGQLPALLAECVEFSRRFVALRIDQPI